MRRWTWVLGIATLLLGGALLARAHYRTWDPCVWMMAEADRRLALVLDDPTFTLDSLRLVRGDPAMLRYVEGWARLARSYDSAPRCLVGWGRVVAVGLPPTAAGTQRTPGTP